MPVTQSPTEHSSPHQKIYSALLTTMRKISQITDIDEEQLKSLIHETLKRIERFTPQIPKNHYTYYGKVSVYGKKTIDTKTDKNQIKKYRKISQKEPIFKRVIPRDSKAEAKLLIHIDYYKTKAIRPYVAILEAAYQLLSFKVFTESAENLAWAITYDLALTGEIKNDLLVFWKQDKPPKEEYNVIIDYPTFFSKLKIKEQHEITKTILKKYVTILNTTKEPLTKKASVFYPYIIFSSTLQTLSKKDLLILNTIITHNTTKIKKIKEIVGYSDPTIRESIRTLRGTWNLRIKPFFSAPALGLLTGFTIFIGEPGISNQLKNFQYKLKKSVISYQSMFETVVMQFLIVNSPQGKKLFTTWKNKVLRAYSFPGKVDLDENTIQAVVKPIIGIEEEDKRIGIQRPELFDIEKKEWLLGDPIGTYEEIINKYNQFEKPKSVIIWNSRLKKIINQIMLGTFSNEEIYQKIKGNRNEFYNTIRFLEENRIVYKKYVLPFYTDLIRALVLIRYEKEKVYQDFVTLFASTTPVSNTATVKVSGKENYLLSFITLPPKQAQQYMIDLRNYFPNAKVTINPSTVEFTIEMDVDFREDGTLIPPHIPELKVIPSRV